MPDAASAANPTAEVILGEIPEAIPVARYDLVVASEILYYLPPPTLEATLACLAARMEPGARLVAVHWRPAGPERPFTRRRGARAGARPAVAHPACLQPHRRLSARRTGAGVSSADAHELLIVGGGPAALSAARAYREAGGSGSVAIVTDERRMPYQRPALSKELLRGETTEEEIGARV